MTKLLIIRHGQSVSNIQGVFTGHLDLELTDLGHQQAALTGEFILENYKVDAVYASDLCRAADTGRAVAEPLGLPLLTDRRLREIYAGSWEGRSFNDLSQTAPSYMVFRNDIGTCQTDGGESVAQLSQRVLEAFYEIADRNEGKTVVITTHATPIRALMTHAQGKTLAEMKNIPWVTNASVTEVIYENGKFYLGKVCQDAHLGSIVSRFPSNV